MTFPPGPQDPWQQPQQFGGAPQYPAPGQYGAPQQPYGAPQPYGYGVAPQPSGGSKKGLIIGAVAGGVLLLVVVIVAVVVMLMPSGDERAIKQTLENIAGAKGNVSEMRKYMCAGDQKFYDALDKLSGMSGISLDAPNTPTLPSDAKTKVSVNGDRATVSVSSSAGSGALHLRKESGEWKVCMSDDPSMPKIPSLP